MTPTRHSIRPLLPGGSKALGRTLVCAALIALPCVASLAMIERARAEAPAVDFERDIKPILAAHCYACHGDKKQESGLRLDSASRLNAGGNSGPAVVAGKSGESLLVQAITGAEDVSKMPPKGPELSGDAIALIRRWVDEGAKLPADAPEVAAGPKADHWSFQPLGNPAPPGVKHLGAVRNPIDAFIVARLEAAGLAPSPPADKAALVRRASLDLVGLPPSVAEVDAFLADTRPDAYERLVDRLLASPHYGERWGRHWLDVARYADSNGYTIDSGRSIWKYRDWVIAACNGDLPFDRFVIDQLAGDLIEAHRSTGGSPPAFIATRWSTKREAPTRSSSASRPLSIASAPPARRSWA